MARNPAGYTSALLGPVNFLVDGEDSGVERRETINLIGATVADNPDLNRVDLTVSAGGTVPSGTGLRKIVAGVEAGAAALLVDADVNAAAAIAASKVVQATGTGIPHVVAGVLTAASSLIVNADVHATAAIAATKVVQATGTGFPYVTSGALDTASVKVDTTNSAHVTVPATANGVVTSSGTVLQQAANVLAGSGYISIGATPADAGAIRLPYASTAIMIRNTGGTANQTVMVIAGGITYFGCNASFGELISGINMYASTSIAMGTGGGTTYLYLAGSVVEAWKPIVGSSIGSSPHGVHGGMSHTFASDANYTVTAAQYLNQRLAFVTGSWTTGHSVILPHPTLATAYGKTIFNNTSQTITVSTGTGTTKTLAAGLAQDFWFDNGGVTYNSATWTP